MSKKKELSPKQIRYKEFRAGKEARIKQRIKIRDVEVDHQLIQKNEKNIGMFFKYRRKTKSKKEKK